MRLLAASRELGKGIGPDGTITAVSVDGNRAYWLAGRAFRFLPRRGQSVSRGHDPHGRQHLLWERGTDTLLRLEGVPSLEQALRVASSVGQQLEH